MKDIKSTTICECLTDLIIKHGVPRVIVCDRGSNFTSGQFKDLMVKWGIRCEPHPPNAHWQSGSVERVHRSIANILQHYLNAYRNDWDTQLPFALFAYRIAYQNGLKSSPFFQLYGRHPETPDTVSLGLPWWMNMIACMTSDSLKQQHWRVTCTRATWTSHSRRQLSQDILYWFEHQPMCLLLLHDGWDHTG